MKLFKKIKKFFTNEVSLDEDPVDLITPYKLKNDKFKIGAKLIVPQGSELLVVCKGKLLEVIREGEYQITPALMPNVANKLKLNKVDKYGKQKDSFSAEAYFIKCDKEIVLGFSNYRKLKFKTGHKDYFTVKWNGKLQCTVENINKLFGLMLTNFSKIEGNSAEFLIEYVINEKLTDTLDKASFTAEDYNQKSQVLITFITDSLRKWLLSLGVNLKEMDIAFTVKEKIAEPKKEKKAKVKLNKEEKKVQNTLGKDVLEKIEVSGGEGEGEVEMYDDEANKIEENNKKYVDLTLEHLYDDKEEINDNKEEN